MIVEIVVGVVLAYLSIAALPLILIELIVEAAAGQVEAAIEGKTVAEYAASSPARAE